MTQACAYRLGWSLRLPSFAALGVFLVSLIALEMLAGVVAWKAAEAGDARKVELLVGSMAYVTRRDFEKGWVQGGTYFLGVLPARVRMLAPSVSDRLRAGNLHTPWGREVTAGGGAVVGSDAAPSGRFWIRVDALPRAACLSIANTLLEHSLALEVRIGDEAPGAVVGDRAAVVAGCDGVGNDGVGVVLGLEVEA